MKKQLLNILFISIVLLLLTGCGSGAGSKNNTNNLESYQIKVDNTHKFTLSNTENLILGYGCTLAKVYDSNEQKVASTFPTDKIDPNNLTKGDYTALFTDTFPKYPNSIGVLYYLSSNIILDELPLNKSINISLRTAKIYKLTLNQLKSLSIIRNNIYVYLYDSNLNLVASNSGWDTLLSDPLNLNSGTHYFVLTPQKCNKESSVRFNSLN